MVFVYLTGANGGERAKDRLGANWICKICLLRSYLDVPLEVIGSNVIGSVGEKQNPQGFIPHL